MPSKQELEIENLKGLIGHLQELMNQRDFMNQKAVELALSSINERLLGMNEFRAQQADVISKFASLEKLDAEISKVSIRIDMLFKEQDLLKEWKSNKQGREAVIQYLYPVIITLIGYLINKFIH